MDPDHHPVILRSVSSTIPQSILLMHPSAAASSCSVRTTRTTPDSTITSRSGTPPAISFAPLPNIEPRKRRKSTHRALGVAGRSELIRRGHQHRLAHHDDGYEAQQHDYDHYEGRVRGNTEEDDALIELGRLMKKAGKNLWDKMGGQKKNKPREDEQATQAAEAETEGVGDAEGVRESVDSDVKVPILLGVDDIQLSVYDGTESAPQTMEAPPDASATTDDSFDPTKTIRG